MKLLELFDKSVDVQWHGPNVAEWQINGVKYQFEMIEQGSDDDDWDDEDEDEDGDWDDDEDSSGSVYVVSFTGQNAAGDMTFDNTGGGNQFLVYTTVFNCIRQFFKTYNVGPIQFEANDVGRQRLYRRFVAKFLPNWTVGSGTSRDVTVYPPGHAPS